MDIETASNITKKITHPKIFQFLRTIAIAFLTPFLFSYKTGHFKSAFAKKAVDKNGTPLPWYSYPAIDFFSKKDFSNKNLLEWGGGQSTIWWSSRAKSIVTLEDNKNWYTYLSNSIPNNCSVHLISNKLNDADEHIKDKKFDLIVVDGLDRFKCATKSIELLNEGGAIILDDSESYDSILEHFKKKGFYRVDFFGYVPSSALQHCTSIFFNKYCFLFEGFENVSI